LSRLSPKLAVMKLVGTGNDFLFIDGRTALPGEFAMSSRPHLVRRLCDRHFGLGSDGLVFVETKNDRYAWDFYNTDGSHAEMCGNATRCFGRWASLKLGLSEIEFTTAAGQVFVTVNGETVSSFLNFVSAHPKLHRLNVAGRDITVFWIDTGVPHFVSKVESIEDSRKQLDVIRELRFHSEAGARGANVTFLEVIGPAKFRTVTYERGVEDFTLSCGTGVLAAAAVGLQLSGAHGSSEILSEHNANLEAEVETPGGVLSVRF
jgi:diaminopimelate epimerase